MNLRSQSDFVCISRSKWILSNGIEKSRKQKLISGIAFEEIVERISKRAVVVSHRREKLPSNPQYYRIVIELKMDCETVDFFHNSVCGYRAQYYHSVSNGKRANKYATDSLVSRVTELLSGKNKQTCPLWLVEKSLSNVHAKIWIHQGRWLRSARNSDQNLLVKRWVDIQQFNADKKKRGKARWASLTPGVEMRIDFKGAYFTLDGKPLGKSTKHSRGNDIHECGFT